MFLVFWVLTPLLSIFPFLEPTADWTVEEAFQWTLLRSLVATNAKFAQLESSIRTTVETGLQGLNDTDPTFQTKTTTNAGDGLTKTTNPVPVPEASRSARSATVAKIAVPPASSFTLQIDILEGEHVGKHFELSITKTKEAYLGRSRGKKFKDGKGISLYKDLEVSTTHGKFVMVDQQPCFVDTGSSNGTRVQTHNDDTNDHEMMDYELPADEPFPLVSGTHLVCGQSRLQVTVVTNN